MHLHITTILLLIFEQVNKVFLQGIPISPCPKIFQYRFDGLEWFGIVSVRNPDFGLPLHLKVSLSVRGKPAANYLGEIELLTRGQFLSDAPVLYKIKFPKTQFPPKLLQITANNQVVCIGAADQSIFVTQIQLEHTRKFTFLSEGIPPSAQASFSPSTFLSDTEAMNLGGGHSASISSTGIDELSLLPTNIAFNNKNFPSANVEKNHMKSYVSKDVCGTIDQRIRFQVSDALKQARTENTDSSLLSILQSRQSHDISMSGKAATKTRVNERNIEDEGDFILPSITSDIDSIMEDAADELPSIPRGAWPWLAAVYVNNLTSLAYQCGGTLVSARIVISAAHCFHLYKQRYTANEVLVFLGRHNLRNWNEEGSLAAPVDDIFIHPEYNQHLNSYDADIAVMILRNKVRFNTFIRPACMWSGSTNNQYIEGEHGIVVGWGPGGVNPPSTNSPVPKVISTPIVSNDACFQANSKYRSLSSNRTFCAGFMVKNHPKEATKSNLHRGPCSGDSGSGLMIFKNSQWMLRGLVSGLLVMQPSKDDSAPRPTQSCSINQYVIYTDVAKFLDWIFAFLI